MLSNEIKEMLVQEAYYGKLPEFEEMEELLKSIITKMKASPKSCNPNKYPEMKKVQKLFSKIFGFKKAIIYWEPYNTYGNAYTYSMNTFIIFANKGKDWIKKTEHGYYDNAHKSVLTVYISTGCVIHGDVNERELLALILHEIGHNFDFSGYHLIGYTLHNILTLGYTGLAYKKYKNIDKINELKEDYNKQIQDEGDKFYNKQKKRTERDNILKEWFKNCEKFNSILSILSLVGNTIALPFNIILSPITQFNTLAGKKGELFADSFATAYGYGTDLMTGLEKLMDKKKDYDPKSKVMSFLQDLGNFQNEVYLACRDVHGSNQVRCKECKKKLLNDLKTNDFQPELKEELLNEINKIDDMYKQITHFSENEKYKITKIWRKINHFLFRGDPALFHKLFKTNRV